MFFKRQKINEKKTLCSGSKFVHTPKTKWLYYIDSYVDACVFDPLSLQKNICKIIQISSRKLIELLHNYLCSCWASINDFLLIMAQDFVQLYERFNIQWRPQNIMRFVLRTRKTCSFSNNVYNHWIDLYSSTSTSTSQQTQIKYKSATSNTNQKLKKFNHITSKCI